MGNVIIGGNGISVINNVAIVNGQRYEIPEGKSIRVDNSGVFVDGKKVAPSAEQVEEIQEQGIDELNITIQCNSIENLTLGGESEITIQGKDDVEIGSLLVRGDLNVNGNLSSAGNVRASDVNVEGNLTVSGTVNGNDLEVVGNFDGKFEGRDLDVEGNLTGDVKGKDIEVGGNVHGSVNAKSISVEGSIYQK